jgi:acyl-CoA synthetase (AMP-forming)/AMP-acid ligase II
MRLHDFLDHRARERGDTEFAIHGDRRITYREALAETNRLANAFVGAGLRIGDRVAVLSKNSIEFVLLYLAASKAGVVLVPLNYRLAPPEWRYILNDSGAKLLIAAGEYPQALEPIRGELTTIERLIAIDSPEIAGWDAYRGWVAGQPASAPDRLITAEHELFQLYTSGTTGHPKGAVLTQRAATAHLVQIGLAHDIRPGERVLLVAPIFHVAAANAAAFPCVFAGGSLYIQTDFNPAEVVRALSEERIGLAILVPAMIQACLTAVPDVARRRYDTCTIFTTAHHRSPRRRCGARSRCSSATSARATG